MRSEDTYEERIILGSWPEEQGKLTWVKWEFTGSVAEKF